jgi:hypothetical protein
VTNTLAYIASPIKKFVILTRGVNVYNLFFFVIELECLSLKLSYPSVIIASKARAYQSGASFDAPS